MHGRPAGNLFALACALALLIASILSSAPGLHEWVHAAAAANHQCAVTLMSAGSCDQSECAGPSCHPPPSREQAFILPPGFKLISERLDFSLLEHAPPAIS